MSFRPRRQDIRKYRTKFTDVPTHVDNVATFVLAFFNTLMLPSQSSLRTLLLDDEQDRKDQQASRLCKEGLHIVTTWEWSRKAKTATFWLRRDVMEEMQRESGWSVRICRTDNWAHQSEPQRLDAVVDTGETWVDGDAATTDVKAGEQ